MGFVDDESGSGSTPTGEEEVADIITAGRYDLRDASSLQYTDAELLEYLNRALRQLENALSRNKSDWLWTEDLTIDLDEDANYASAPSRCLVVREVWIDSDQIEKKTHDYVNYRRQFNSAGKPTYWAHVGTSINFDRDADQAYDLKVYFDQRSAALTTSGNMPYGDEFNDALRQMMVFCAKNRQEYAIDLDAQMYNFFLASAMDNVARKKHPRRRYKLDF